ncbi:hypothetical protein LEN26_000216 [Aphanomyces euteiches]|nr:hypothetical protein AeMF1_001686 [Aphanomyces euteiches]KAH9131471.1 hypothetical protein AeNC1_019617 [Aphanomyces euteiches]KAH9164070.1 hypothetical protein LEN26_000216 [Aphanomyces euteiches]
MTMKMLLRVVLLVALSTVFALESNSTSANSTNSTGNITVPTVTSPGQSTKHKDAGLSGVVYAGIAIGVVAVLGFFVECCMHKRTYWSKRNEINAGLQTHLPDNRIV